MVPDEKNSIKAINKVILAPIIKCRYTAGINERLMIIGL